MNVIIVGIGRTGISIVKNLSSESHNIVAIDLDSERINDAVNRYDIQGICGNGCMESILEEAGVENTDLLISVTDSDEQNILSCLMGKAMGVKHLIAHVRNPEYFSQFEGMREKFGIGMFINPEATLAEEITKLLRFPSAVKVSSFSGGRLEIAEIKVSKDSKICGKTLKELKHNSKTDFLIVAIVRGDEVIVPNGSTVIEEDDVINVCAKHFELKNLFSYFGFLKHKVQSVMILGCNDDAYYLASILELNGFNVKLIGKNYDKCLELKNRLENVNVICDDFTDKDVLDREGIDSVGAVVSMSTYDENNIVTSLYAKNRRVSKVITVLRKDEYSGILQEIDLESPVSPYELAGAEIAKYVRSIDVPKDSQILSMQKIAGGRAEALFFNVGGNTAFVGKSVKDLNVNMKDGVLIVAVSRKRTSVIPDGNTLIEEDDGIIVASVKNTIYQLEDVLK